MIDQAFQTKTLQDYEVISVIGSGAFGTCFKVRDKETDQIYAWKGMDYDELSETNKKSLISEINVLRQLQHPNIVQYYHHLVNHETKSIFIVMECCEGGDLAQLIGKCRQHKQHFEEKYIWRVLFQICKALQVCHNKIEEGTILHHDIKPANIFLDTEGNAKLGDFGLRVLQRNENFAQSMIGTPYYMSPEIVKGSQYDRKSDVWAVGCLIYEMCCLRPPFEGNRFNQLSKNISGGKFLSIPDWYSSDLQEIIAFMLEVDNDQRPNIDIITRHPILVRNIVDIPNEFPKLIAFTSPEVEDTNFNLNFTPRTDFSSTALSHFTVTEDESRHITDISTPVLRSEIFNSVKRKILPKSLRSSDPELYESILQQDDATIRPTTTGYSPTIMTQNIFEKTLQDRLHAIRAYECLLKQREIALQQQEQKLNEREKRLLEMERDFKAKQAAATLLCKRTEIQCKPKKPHRLPSTRRIPKKVNCDDTYCSIEPNESLIAPTVAKLNLATMVPPKSLARKVTFKSPKKFTKYDLENIPPSTVNGSDSKSNTLRSSTSSKTSEDSDGGHKHKRKSILSIFGINKVKDNKSNQTPTQQDLKNSDEVIEKCKTEELSTIWTTENKRAAFDMLAAMNAATGKLASNGNGLIGLQHRRKTMREKGSLRRSQHLRRSVIGLSVGMAEAHGSRIIL